ncbi:MAG: type 1 glutamine amidotransferase [Pseudomonadota bacterium]
MTRILVAEGNTPALLHGRTEQGLAWTAEAYGAALAHFAPQIEIEVTRPYFDGWDPGRIAFDNLDGMVVTGSGVAWSGADARARGFWQLYERAFASGVPALGSCWGLQTAAVVLGGDTGAGPNGVEAGFAREVSLTDTGRDHPLHRGREGRFDVLCMHRDDVTRLPEGAVATATNAHTQVQAMVYEDGTTQFWGMQYHPEITLSDVAYYFSRSEGACADDGFALGHSPVGMKLVDAAPDLAAIHADPSGTAALQARYDVTGDILDFDRHAVELRNWLTQKLGVNVAG